MTKVAVIDDWQRVARESADWSGLSKRATVTFFAEAFASEDEAAARLADYDIVLSMRERTPFPSSLLSRLPRLKMLGITGLKNASVDVDACTARGVVVCNTTAAAGSMSSTAELALGLLLSVARSIPAGDAGIRAGGFQETVASGMTLSGKTLGVIGLGRLGSMMARYGIALGMRVIAWSRNLNAGDAAAGERIGRLVGAFGELMIEDINAPLGHGGAGITGANRNAPHHRRTARRE